MNASSPASEMRAARASSSDVSAFNAAALSARASWPVALASGRNWKPDSVPTCWPSTMTSPVDVTSASSIAFSRRRRIRTLVRRSTNRAASRSWSASDSLSSTPRVTPCQCSGAASQSGLFAAKVQVRICAMRLDSVSMSPSVRSSGSIWRANQSAGMRRVRLIRWL
jgi:hypothetical protein